MESKTDVGKEKSHISNKAVHLFFSINACNWYSLSNDCVQCTVQGVEYIVVGKKTYKDKEKSALYVSKHLDLFYLLRYLVNTEHK